MYRKYDVGESVTQQDIVWWKDWKFWILFLVINMSGNLCFDYIFPYKLILIFVFLVITAYSFIKNYMTKQALLFILLFCAILLLQGFYTSENYSFSSTIHILLKVCTGILTLLILQKKFIPYYVNIIFFFSIISLCCFTYNAMGGVIPYLTMDKTLIDGGRIYRVSSMIYTQLYGPTGGLTLRNCGPFWEPGAFQGFLNLAIMLLLLSKDALSKKCIVKVCCLTVAVITTFSTGGYIVLFCIILYALCTTDRISVTDKIYLFVVLTLLLTVCFFSLDFLYKKVSTDKGRLGVSLDSFGDGIYLLFGYGYSEESFKQSDLVVAGSIFSLIRYMGVIGLGMFFATLLGVNLTKPKLFFAIVIFLILMNEPFLTAGPFWWSIPFLWKYIEEIRETVESPDL